MLSMHRTRIEPAQFGQGAAEIHSLIRSTTAEVNELGGRTRELSGFSRNAPEALLNLRQQVLSKIGPSPL